MFFAFAFCLLQTGSVPPPKEQFAYKPVDPPSTTSSNHPGSSLKFLRLFLVFCFSFALSKQKKVFKQLITTTANITPTGITVFVIAAVILEVAHNVVSLIFVW